MGRGLVVVMVVSCLTCVPGIRRYASTFNGLKIIEFVNLKGFHGKGLLLVVVSCLTSVLDIRRYPSTFSGHVDAELI